MSSFRAQFKGVAVAAPRCHATLLFAANSDTVFRRADGGGMMRRSTAIQGFRITEVPMPSPVPVPIRQAIWDRHQQGDSPAELAEAFGLPARTVRGLLQRGRRGPEALAPRPGPAASPTPGHPAWAPAVLLRREHPAWGTGLIRVMLRRQGIEPLPDARTLRRWFAKAGLGPARQAAGPRRS